MVLLGAGTATVLIGLAFWLDELRHLAPNGLPEPRLWAITMGAAITGFGAMAIWAGLT